MYQNIGDLICIKKLGEGSFGKVGLYKHNNSNNVFAVKIINKLKETFKLFQIFKFRIADVKNA